jgi:hypothetical protein
MHISTGQHKQLGSVLVQQGVFNDLDAMARVSAVADLL